MFKQYTDARLGPSTRNMFTGSPCPHLEGDQLAQRMGCMFPELPREPMLGVMSRECSEKEKWAARGADVEEAGTVGVHREKGHTGVHRGASNHGRECARDGRL